MAAFYGTCQSRKLWRHLWQHFRNHVNHIYQQHFWQEINYAIDFIWGITEEATSDLCRTSTENGIATCTPSLESYFEVVCAAIEWRHS